MTMGDPRNYQFDFCLWTLRDCLGIRTIIKVQVTTILYGV
ncbi:MAG: hypothetical protein [Olavius algarvensis Gamma 1 endosymbiont]|nr:MAG: hypothetical protein [Olavius algarvensis Gamma 1 endosymbiont]